MIKGSEQKIDPALTHGELNKVSASVGCFPIPEKPAITKFLNSIKPEKRERNVVRREYYKEIVLTDKVIIEKIMNDDIEELKSRYVDERCINCGNERSLSATTFCGHCYSVVLPSIKRELRRFTRQMTIINPPTLERININDERRKMMKSQSR